MNPHLVLRDVLNAYKSGDISLKSAEEKIQGLQIEELGEIARIDTGRGVRCGMPEVVLGEGKDRDHLIEIILTLVRKSGKCIATRVPEDVSEEIAKAAAEEDFSCEYHPNARTLVASRLPSPSLHGGTVGILTAGTSDIRVAEEARIIAEEMGCRVVTAYDVGAAGIHRLFPAIGMMQDADVYIVAAGREGTLPSVVAGLVSRPVIGVPVSTGYGYMGHGEAALASMLQSCSVIAVVNIDAGFTAGAFAAQIARGTQNEED
ncbi:nickel pincer cofactor biosynthesis protein LarB [Methanogenium organophilum]|uniref:Nickel pincer cofactor biosynthesis protein LarB n=1 Tax=Methanogenium organophilum TaxID=2199 RepID=A0A9X9S659_METOG|nr:nickel pincer cofactor biosynthesis protein LarB [Methanogenium organophilum]WAI01610.1 nickel pincer cofactor biosynthesis protein LarB [Methanogenium organophilum]